MPAIPDAPRSRRGLLLGGAGALAGALAGGILHPGSALAATAAVLRGRTNRSTRTTVVLNAAGGNATVALVGRTTVKGDSSAGAALLGQSDGLDGTGVRGISLRGEFGYGVWGDATEGIGGKKGVGVEGRGGIGVVGRGAYGVIGYSDDETGAGVLGLVQGTTAGTTGLAGVITEGGHTGDTGIFGQSLVTDGVGVWGDVTKTGGIAVNGGASGTNGIAVRGVASGTGGIGVYGESLSGEAGHFKGTLYADTLVTGAAATQVDHPAAPAQAWLRHALVGSLEQVTTIGGNARTDGDGRVTVEVDAAFARWHRDVRYQLTAVGERATLWVAAELADGRFTIASDPPKVAVSWQLTGVRDDPVARAAGPFRARVEKAPHEQGRFADPAAWGRPAGRRFGPARAAAVRATPRLRLPRGRGKPDLPPDTGE